MAFDGVVISAVVRELQNTVIGGRIYKIYQPETDELNIIVKNNRETVRLLLSASATLPLLYIAKQAKNNPVTAPNFCMLLRKHIGNGRIVAIEQPQFERIIVFHIEHLNELGDICRKKLIIELMGKHSNIIFVNDENLIIDSIKHISAQTSSVREVLPGRQYIIPPTHNKMNPMQLVEEAYDAIWKQPMGLCKAIYSSLTGISPTFANDICFRCGLDGNQSTNSLTVEDRSNLQNEMTKTFERIHQGEYRPTIYYKEHEPIEFSAIPLLMYGDCVHREYDSISEVLEEYYASKDIYNRIRQKSIELRKIVSNAIERASKKYDLQLNQLRDTDKREKYKLYGELLHTYSYEITSESKNCTVMNYYTNQKINIPLDDTLSVKDNATRYYAKYNKLKRTYEALTNQLQQTKAELDHLLSIQNSLDITLAENDLYEIKQELISYGYIKSKGKEKQRGRFAKSKPFHYISSEGFHIYVGKNNYQNDELTFKFANGKDMWFHAKQMPGSHVVVKLEGEQELPDHTYEEAARLAAYYSSGRTNPKVEVDYTQRSNLKKPAGAAPGFVIYHTNYSMVIEPDIQKIRLISEDSKGK